MKKKNPDEPLNWKIGRFWPKVVIFTYIGFLLVNGNAIFFHIISVFNDVIIDPKTLKLTIFTKKCYFQLAFSLFFFAIYPQSFLTAFAGPIMEIQKRCSLHWLIWGHQGSTLKFVNVAKTQEFSLNIKLKFWRSSESEWLLTIFQGPPGEIH